jgi:hypothetical protein
VRGLSVNRTFDLRSAATVRFGGLPGTEIHFHFFPIYPKSVDLYQKTVDGSSSEELLSTDDSKQATDWSRDGQYVPSTRPNRIQVDIKRPDVRLPSTVPSASYRARPA